MYTGSVFDEVVRLSQYSLRLRAHLAMMMRNAHRRPTEEMKATLRRLVRDVQITIGEPVIPQVDWPEGRIPKSFSEAQTFLQRPELLDTENYQRALWHADWGKPDRFPGVLRETYVCPEIRVFTRRLIKLGQDRRVPLFAEKMFIRREVQADAYVKCLTNVPPEESPYCHGRAVLIGHMAEWPDWHPACLKWLNALAELACADTGVRVHYSPDRPAEFFAVDDDGVICSPSEPLPDPDLDPEVEDLAAAYGIEPVPWVSPYMPGRESELAAHIPDDGGFGEFYDHEPAVAARAFMAHGRRIPMRFGRGPS